MSTRSRRFSRPLSDPKRYETTKAQITSSRVRRLHRAVDKAARWDCISPTISKILFGRTRVQPE